MSGPHKWRATRINYGHSAHADHGPADVCDQCQRWRRQQPDGSYLYSDMHPPVDGTWFAEAPERPCWAAPDPGPSAPSAPSDR